MEDYLSEFGSKKVNDLTLKELKRFFILATDKEDNYPYYFIEEEKNAVDKIIKIVSNEI